MFRNLGRIGFALAVIASVVVLVNHDAATKNKKKYPPEVTLAFGEISRSIYIERGVYVEFSLKRAGGIFRSAAMGGQLTPKNGHLKMTLFFSREKMDQITKETGGDVKRSEKITSIMKFAFEKIKERFPEIQDRYEVSVKVTPASFALRPPEAMLTEGGGKIASESNHP